MGARDRRLGIGLLLGVALWLAGWSTAQAQITNYSYTYWNANEPGWGFNVLHQGDLLYGTWYSYADDGKAMFLTVEGAPQADGSFSGSIYRVAGTPFEQINGMQAFTAATEIGTANMAFDGSGNLTLTYTINGVTQSKQLERFTFDPAAPVCVGTTESRAGASNYSDLWWNDSEAGWGLTISHQGDVIFLLWYTYGEGGRDQWISASTLVRQPDGSFSGALQRPVSGTPLSQIAGPATTFPVPEIGTATLTFSDGENGTFRYVIGGVDQSKAIKRFVVVGADEAKPICMVAGGGGGGTGNPDACFPEQHVVGQTRRVRITSGGASSELEHVVVGSAMFQGQSATLIEIRQPNGDLTRDYRRIENGEEVIVGQELVSGGTVNTTVTYAPLPRTPLAPPLGQQLSQDYVVTTTGAGSVATTEKIKLVRRESVTVPAGTFDNACYLEREIISNAGPVTTVTEQKIWSRADVAEVIRAESVSRINFPGAPPLDESVQELISIGQ